ncbi:ATP-dependent nuclease [Burkholderia pseudomallei]|uniref:ATP-dependent nuclease n=1 Tax=Burkholderia pseudomallei TaxID=28450 RepID=UPI001EF9E85D|nr:AAA family ATPase [Burkholderia pseudomallei]
MIGVLTLISQCAAMKIKRIKIENFRSIQNQSVELNQYACFVGPNGAGKSTVLAALNVFFQERVAGGTDVTKLADEDFHRRNVAEPVSITVTFDGISDAARESLAAYVRGDELTVTAEAVYDQELGFATIRHYGQRLGFEAFRRFFEADKEGARAPVLNEIYAELQGQYVDLRAARSKEDKISALRDYEAQRPQDCVLIPSADDFYGVNSTGKLAAHLQWVYVPAVKDAYEEGQEAKNTALGKLIARAVRTRTNFDEQLETLKTETLQRYRELLDRNQEQLTEIAGALQRRLEAWAHPNVQLSVAWLSDPTKSVTVQQPLAGIATGDGEFVGSLARMGHGLQRSYLLALLQELAGADAPNAPTLILGCEEPELYQHPPQARHLAEVFSRLTQPGSNNQILVTTHSPLFVNGEGFENVRLVRRLVNGTGSVIGGLDFQRLCARIREVRGEDVMRPLKGIIAKIHQALQPNIGEMFFSRVPILVEGQEDASYITTYLHLSGMWDEFRRLGCHLIPVNGKDKLIQPLAMANELGLPVFTIFDADSNITRNDHRIKHERDNRALIALLAQECELFPNEHFFGHNCVVWKTNMGDAVKEDFGENFEQLANTARMNYANEGGLEKHDLFIADWLDAGAQRGMMSQTLRRLCEAILEHARHL